MAQSANRILNALSQNIFAAMEPHFRLVTLTFGDIIADTGASVAKVYFPFSGVVSLVVEMDVGDMIETAMVGRDGVVNGTSSLDGRVSLHKAMVQVPVRRRPLRPIYCVASHASLTRYTHF